MFFSPRKMNAFQPGDKLQYVLVKKRRGGEGGLSETVDKSQAANLQGFT